MEALAIQPQAETKAMQDRSGTAEIWDVANPFLSGSPPREVTHIFAEFTDPLWCPEPLLLKVPITKTRDINVILKCRREPHTSPRKAAPSF